MYKKMIETGREIFDQGKIKIMVYAENMKYPKQTMQQIQKKIERGQYFLDMLAMVGLSTISIHLGDEAELKPGINFHIDQFLNGKNEHLFYVLEKIREYHYQNGGGIKNVKKIMEDVYIVIKKLASNKLQVDIFKM